MGKANRNDVSGVLLLDKQTGQSSNWALQRVKRLFNAKKTGHTGTLDPLASGLLPLVFGHATKFASDLIDSDKEYEAIVRLGFQSTTGDAEGVLTEIPGTELLDLSDEFLAKVAQGFVGEIDQVPPMYSALKHAGKPLYEYARQGVEIGREARKIVIKELDVKAGVSADFTREAKDGVNCGGDDAEGRSTPSFPGQYLWLRVVCSKGTYVRTLGEDFARKLGTQGYLTALRRTGIGSLRIEDALRFDQLEDKIKQGILPSQFLAPVDCLLDGLSALHLDAKQTQRCLHGQRLALGQAGLIAGRTRIYGVTASNETVFLGTGLLETDGKTALLRPKKLIQDTQ